MVLGPTTQSCTECFRGRVHESALQAMKQRLDAQKRKSTRLIVLTLAAVTSAIISLAVWYF